MSESWSTDQVLRAAERAEQHLRSVTFCALAKDSSPAISTAHGCCNFSNGNICELQLLKDQSRFTVALLQSYFQAVLVSK